MQAKLSVRTIDNTSFFKYYDGKSFLVYFLYPSLVLHWRTLAENIQQLSMNLRNAFFASFIELILNNLVVFYRLRQRTQILLAYLVYMVGLKYSEPNILASNGTETYPKIHNRKRI